MSRCPIYLMPGMRCASERGHDGRCAPYEPDEPTPEVEAAYAAWCAR